MLIQMMVDERRKDGGWGMVTAIKDAANYEKGDSTPLVRARKRKGKKI